MSKLEDAKNYITEQYSNFGNSPWLEGWICGVTDKARLDGDDNSYEELMDHLNKLRTVSGTLAE